MKAPQYEVSDIIRYFGKDFLGQCSPNPYQQRVLNALTICRTAALGGHTDRCDTCHRERYSYNSCRNRHCPKCQWSRQAFWIEDLIDTIIKVKHYHIVFTVPETLNNISLLNSRWFYNSFFVTAWDTLKTFGYIRFAAESGAICVLHTWGQNLCLHPHIHCIVPAAGISLSGKMKAIGKNGNYLYNVNQLSKVFRGKFMQILNQYLCKQGLAEEYKKLIKSLWKTDWVVYCEPAMGKAEHVIRYLGQYTHRVAITNKRIVSIKEGKVTFRYKDYSHAGKQKLMSIDGIEFLRRFCLHILPLRFVRIRRYGIYSSRMRALNKICVPKMQVTLRKKETVQERIKRLTGFDVYKCPFCKYGYMYKVEDFPRIRSPDSLYAIACLSKN